MSPAATPSVLADLRFAVVDLETTGLDTTMDHILQIAVVMTDATGAGLGSWSTYVKPPRWPFTRLGPREIHGIRHSMLLRAPRTADALRELAGWLEGCVLTAHNADFDLAFLRRQSGEVGVTFPEVPVVCTLMLSRSLDPGYTRSHRLVDLCTRYGVVLERAHDALEDARATSRVLPHLLAEAGITTTERLLVVARPMSERR